MLSTKKILEQFVAEVTGTNLADSNEMEVDTGSASEVVTPTPQLAPSEVTIATANNTLPKEYLINSNELIKREFELGHGVYGIISLGEYKGKAVAIKEMLLPSPSKKHPDPKARLDKIFRREIEIQVKLETHLAPNIVQFYGYHLDGGYFIVNELVTMNTLSNYIEKQKQPSLMVQKKIAIDILEALKYLHDRKVIHHDVKPVNILLDEKLTLSFVILDCLDKCDQRKRNRVWEHHYGWRQKSCFKLLVMKKSIFLLGL